MTSCAAALVEHWVEAVSPSAVKCEPKASQSLEMKILDQVVAWAIAAIGMVHAGATWVIYKQFSMSAVWFFDAAVVFWLTAALNLLRIRYAAVAPGIRITSIGA